MFEVAFVRPYLLLPTRVYEYLCVCTSSRLSTEVCQPCYHPCCACFQKAFIVSHRPFVLTDLYSAHAGRHVACMCAPPTRDLHCSSFSLLSAHILFNFDASCGETEGEPRDGDVKGRRASRTAPRAWTLSVFTAC